MRTTSFPRALVVLALALGIVAAACSSASPEESTATTTVEDISDEGVVAMCRTLELLSSAGVPAGNAAEAIATTDLDGLTSQEKSAYGELLLLAPTRECPGQADFADEITYWLGF